jgi:predicted phosphate transport protein (TIGR00153 family)
MFNLIPKEVRFFELFDQQSAHIIKAAALLHELVHNFADARAKTHQIKEVEHQGDQITHEIVKRLNTTFITPIDREDIHRLAVRLDDVIDLIDGTVRRLAVFNITEPTPAGSKLSAIIVQITFELVEAVADLRKQKGVIEHCIRIKKFENEGDVAYQEAIGSLFRQSIPPIEVIKWKDVYENMERCLDICEAVAHVLESVVLKHS